MSPDRTRLECLQDLFFRVDEIDDEGIFLIRMAPVQAGKRLHCLDAAQLLVDNHGMQERLIKAGLIFLRNDNNVTLIMEDLFGLGFSNMIAFDIHVEASFCVLRFIRVIQIFDAA